MKDKETKYIFITGGVVSSLGKGITAASLALLLKKRNFKVNIQKLDPYLNVDPGTMSPYQHGEVYVTCDGAETDLDLGHYERFSEIKCTKSSNYTAGQIYLNVLEKERKGDYLGGTVQVIPHITNEIKRVIKKASVVDGQKADILIVEIGGTAGDIESLPFLEAIRQFRQEVKDNAIFIHLTLIPYIAAAQELKTKPSQQSVSTLRSIGIMPDMLVCRSEHPLEEEHLDKLALFCNIAKEYVIEELDVENSVYEVPLELHKNKLDNKVLELLNLPSNNLNLDDWKAMLDRLLTKDKHLLKIAIIGKYVSLQDAYKSIHEAINHAAIAFSSKIEFVYIDSDKFDEENTKVDGIIVPGGFGNRGIEGKIKVIKFARENNIPFLGICLGMQCAVIETARNLANLTDANSAEFDVITKNKVIDLMLDQRNIEQLGASMRLGSYPCSVKENTLAHKIYQQTTINERHRHRYEFNNKYTDILTDAGLIISGTSPDNNLVEIVERSDHPWFIACQFHPEFQSSPLNPHPLFLSLVEHVIKHKNP